MRAREIKFRAWDRRLKLMFNNSEIIIKNSKVTHLKDKEFFSIEYDPIYKVELMQYTGLKDKNGVEIYEGDILKTSRFSGYFPISGEYDIGKVTYEDTCFCLEIKKDVMATFKILSEHCEVIGNIYETPELLDK